MRERRGESLKSAALAAGLAQTSGSTVSLWERGEREISVRELRRLAKFYEVPEAFFTEPPMTDEERLEAALADAGALERADWAAGQDQGPGAGGAPDAERRRRLQ